ncbi:MAG: hypothetical protein JWN62_2498 [Acidimicrobiales bacterium]|nr:hypothetical protein [Acidimicrobiales bacterium]
MNHHRLVRGVALAVTWFGLTSTSCSSTATTAVPPVTTPATIAVAPTATSFTPVISTASSSASSSASQDTTIETAAATTGATTAPTAAAEAAPTEFDPCSVITEQDVTTALGVDPGPGEPTPEVWGGQCSYDSGTVILNVLIGDAHLGGKAGYDTYLAGAQQGESNDTSGRSVFEVLDGIGDGAFVNGGGPIAGAAFYAGDTTVTLTVALGDATLPTPIAQATALMTAGAARLES